jgi:hypothetical protein
VTPGTAVGIFFFCWEGTADDETIFMLPGWARILLDV